MTQLYSYVRKRTIAARRSQPAPLLAGAFMALAFMLLFCQLAPFQIYLVGSANKIRRGFETVQRNFHGEAGRLSGTLNAATAAGSREFRRERAWPRRKFFLPSEEKIKETLTPNQVEKFKISVLDYVIAICINLPRNLIEVWVGRYHPHLTCLYQP